MRYIIALLFLLAGSVTQAQAQTADTLPEPETIFADGVQWAVAEDTPAYQPYIPARATSDAIEVFDAVSEQWVAFPLPEDMPPVSMLRWESDEHVVLITEPPDSPQTSYWLLNPQTGHYQPLPSVCAGTTHQAIPGDDGEWIVVAPNEQPSIAEAEPFLCHTADDTRHELPAEENLAGWQLDETPDANRLVLSARDLNTGGDYRFFVYDVSRQQFTSPGTVSGFEGEVRLCGWVSETHGVICAESYRIYLPTRFYALDITQPDTLERLFSGWFYQDTFQMDDPVRFVSLNSPTFTARITGTTAPDDARCTLTIYDADGLQTYDMGKDCLPFSDDTIVTLPGTPFYRHGDTLYLLGVATDTSTVSTLHRFDTRTLEHRAFNLAMEMEAIAGVSPDGRYIAVLLDDDGDVYSLYRSTSCCGEHDSKRVAILPTYEDDFLYQSQPLGVSTAPDVTWLDNQTLIIKSRSIRQYVPLGEGDTEAIPYHTRPSLHRVTLTDTGYSEQSMTIPVDKRWYGDFALDITPDSPFAIVSESQIIDLRTLQPVTLLQPGIREQYAIRVYRTSQGEIQLNISNPANHRMLQAYTLQLP